jgi:hypothetical protein
METVMRTLLATGLAAATLMFAGCSTYGFPGSGFPSSSSQSGQYGQYGRYGNDRQYRDGGVVRCESNDERTRTCAANTRGGVRLIRRLSDAQCIEGSSWGHDNRGIWVSRGCRADFQLGTGNAYGNSGYGAPGYGSGNTVRCESQDNRQRRCNVRVTRSVTLIRKLSDSACVQGRTWGWDGGGIWVDRGCRAEFSVR